MGDLFDLLESTKKLLVTFTTMYVLYFGKVPIGSNLTSKVLPV